MTALSAQQTPEKLTDSESITRRTDVTPPYQQKRRPGGRPFGVLILTGISRSVSARPAG